jgi:hypothetical protein
MGRTRTRTGKLRFAMHRSRCSVAHWKDVPSSFRATTNSISLELDCIVFPQSMERATVAVPCHDQLDGDRVIRYSLQVQGNWLVLLACGALEKEQWAQMIKSGKRVRGFDRGASHLCGNAICMNPWHLVAKSHQKNMTRKVCHQRDRCRCGQSVRYQVDLSRRRDLDTDHNSLWQAALRAAQTTTYSCPIDGCKFLVDFDPVKGMSVNRLATQIAEHINHRHSPLLAPESPAQVLFVPNSQSPEPEFIRTTRNRRSSPEPRPRPRPRP